MSQAIRTEYHVVTDYQDPEKFTLRQAVNWWKTVAIQMGALGTPTALEHKYVNERWVAMLKAIADREGIPVGMLSYFLGELAQKEIELADTAREEAEVALGYGQ